MSSLSIYRVYDGVRTWHVCAVSLLNACHLVNDANTAKRPGEMPPDIEQGELVAHEGSVLIQSNPIQGAD